jgi:hypothetical protein
MSALCSSEFATAPLASVITEALVVESEFLATVGISEYSPSSAHTAETLKYRVALKVSMKNRAPEEKES